MTDNVDAVTVARSRIRAWRKRPWIMVAEEFGTIPDRWQKRVLKAFASDDEKSMRIAMVACKGPGKTAVLAWIILNFLGCYGARGEHPKGAAISITQANIDDNLWPEIAKWQARSRFFSHAFVWTSTRIYAKDHPKTWFFSKRAFSRSAKPQSQANALAGLHAKFLLFVLDESGGMPRPIMATADAGLSNALEKGGWAKIVQAGNPTDLDGPLHDAATIHKKFWTVFHITGDPDDPNRSPRVSKKWAQQQIELYGIDNPWVLVNVFGRFPQSSINTLFAREEVEAAMERHLPDEQYIFSQKRMGVDVASEHGDGRTVLFPRQGRAAFKPDVRRNISTDVIASVIVKRVKEWGSEVVAIDDTGGWAAGAIDQCALAGYPLLPINFGGIADDPRYYNKRAEIYFRLQDWIKTGSIPRIPELVDELCAMTYTFKAGKFLLEEKQQVKDRIGISPDLADALALTFALAELPTGEAALPPALRGRHRQLQHEWDPYAEPVYAE